MDISVKIRNLRRFLVNEYAIKEEYQLMFESIALDSEKSDCTINSICLSGQRYSDCHIHANNITGCLDCGNFKKNID